MTPGSWSPLQRARTGGSNGWGRRWLAVGLAFALAIIGLPLTALPASAAASNIARSATASASSENPATFQTADKAIDGSAVGFPGDYKREWATKGGKGGSYLELTWASPVTIDRVVLYDRPNTNDRITGGQLTFSSGSAVAVGSLNNAGAATQVTFTSRTVTSLRLTVTSVSSATQNIGLAEIEAWGSPASTVNNAPTAAAGADVSAFVKGLVTLDGSGSRDPDGNTLTYAWTAPAGVTLSDAKAQKPSFTPDAVGQYTFSLVVYDGLLYSAPDTVVVNVAEAVITPTNLARNATATASSQNPTTTQTAGKAIDGSAAGYPGDSTREWATAGGKANSTLTLTWATPVTLDRVVLYDRPNANDQITAGTLSFSSGGPVTFGALPNAGTAFEIKLNPARTTTSLTLTITSVSASTKNIGLAEIEAWGIAGKPENRAPVANAGVAVSTLVDKAVTLDGDDSSDADGDALTYAWTASGGTLKDETSATPTFSAAVLGDYTLTLVVNDGKLSSAPTTVTVSVTPNHQPTANAGADQSVSPGSLVTLAGTGSDPDGQTLTYLWTAPVSVTLSDPTAQKPTFTAGAAGTSYTFTLTVNDGEMDGIVDTVVITVQPLGVLTVANSGTSAVFSANFESGYSGKTIKLQKQTIATTMGTDMKNFVAAATWVTVGSSVKANASGDANFTIADPLEVEHVYRAVVDEGAATQKFTNELAYAAPRSTKDTGLATIYVDTNESETISSKFDYWEGTFTMDGPTGSRCAPVAQAKMKVSGRGNSTWDLPKKPYKFGLEASTDLCGMGKSKKWNLIANYEDDTLIRNSLAMKMGSLLPGLEWTPKSTPVDVYVNGKFQGSYTLMDRVNVDKTRVNIPKLKNTSTDITGGYLLEWDNRRTSDHNVFVGSTARSDYVGTEQSGAYSDSGWVGIKEPENETDGTGITAAQLDYIDSYLETANTEIKKGNWQPYLDANSTADYIIAMELTKNYGANMRSSVFMYKKADSGTTPGKLFFGPLWDFDTAFGNATQAGPEEASPEGWWVSEPNSSITAVQGTPTWFHYLMDDPTFQQIVKTRWVAMQSSGFKATTDAFIASEKAFVTKSVAADGTVWGSNDLNATVGTLQTWYAARWAWLDSQWDK